MQKIHFYKYRFLSDPAVYIFPTSGYAKVAFEGIREYVQGGFKFTTELEKLDR